MLNICFNPTLELELLLLGYGLNVILDFIQSFIFNFGLFARLESINHYFHP